MIRNKIWYELIQSKFNEVYVTNLIGVQRQWLNALNFGIALFSTAGIMGWKYWENLPAIACGIISLFSIVKLVQAHLFPSEKQIEKLNEIAKFYFNHTLKLEQLWMDFEYERLNETQSQEKIFQLKQSEEAINSQVNELIKRKNQEVFLKSRKECNQYFLQQYNTRYE